MKRSLSQPSSSLFQEEPDEPEMLPKTGNKTLRPFQVEGGEESGDDRSSESGIDAPAEITVFPHIVVWGSCFLLHLLARPPPSSSLLPPSSSLTTTSLTQHLSPQHLSLQHHSDNIPHTTSRIQHHALTQHLAHNITHTTSHTQRLAYNITHTTSLTTASHTQHHSRNIPHTTSLTQHLQHARCLPRGRMPRGRMYALASSGVGWAPAQISWQAQHFAACQGVGCTPWRRLASSGVGWAPAQISWQAQHFAACQGVGCTPWRRLASAGHRRRFRGRRSALLLAKGSDVRPGVVWCRLGTRSTLLLAKGRMYALASSGVGWHRRRFRGRRSTLLLAKGSDVRRLHVVWRRLGTGAYFAAGAALCCLPRGRMYALASSGVGWAPAQISWQAQHFVNLHVQISWQAQHLWRLCSTTFVRGVSAGLEDENWRLCSTTLVRGAICGAGSRELATL